jgi:hypothetical protein
MEEADSSEFTNKARSERRQIRERTAFERSTHQTTRFEGCLAPSPFPRGKVFPPTPNPSTRQAGMDA